jgi:hypothetical protein
VSKYSIGNLKVVSIIRFFILKNISKNALFYQKGKKLEEARSKKQEARSKKQARKSKKQARKSKKQATKSKKKKRRG